uniref:Telomerase activating protein Est1-like N-terminal domain-containing protein n=1 Tax=Plectus sambesii TaxID=2011161 RepID=A0A914UR56_9BILA
MASSTTATDATSEKYSSVRKHYKIVVDCIRRLDQAGKDKQNIGAVSQPETSLIRDRLRESCEKLLFTSPLEYGKKAEDQIWKKCFYEPIQILRANKERLSEKQKCWAVMFLQSAVGYYHGFLLRLQREFGVDVNV